MSRHSEETHEDASVAALARLFAEHPAWRDAARHVSDDATSAVYFTHLPGQPFRLVRRSGETRLVSGRADDPDFAFRFSPPAVERLDRCGKKVSDFAVELFRLMLEPEPESGVGFRVVAGFPRLIWRGYLRLLMAAGPPVVAFGATQGVRSVSDLRRLVRESRGRPPESWED